MISGMGIALGMVSALDGHLVGVFSCMSRYSGGESVVGIGISFVKYEERFT